MKSLGTAHVFEEVSCLLPTTVWKHVEELRPKKEDSNQSKAGQHGKQREYLQRMKLKLKPAEASAKCTRHGCMCKVQWADDPACPAHRRPFKVNFSGPVCVPWSCMGPKLGYADASVESYNIWLAHNSACGPPANLLDVVFIENSDMFPWDDFVDGMGKGFLCLKAASSLSSFGLPMHRPRCYGAAINNDTLVWVGPTTQEGILADFMNIFGRRVDLDADDFAHIDKDHTLQLRTALAKNRGIFGDVINVPLEDLLAPTQRDVWEMAKDMYRTGSAQTSLKGCLVVDLSQSVMRARPRPWFSSPTQGTLTASVSKDHIFTRPEVDFVMGWPVIPTPSNTIFEKCVPDAYWKFNVSRETVTLASVNVASGASSTCSPEVLPAGFKYPPPRPLLHDPKS
jgi:hypothetical protein